MLTKEEREERDEASANAALGLVIEKGMTPAIAVDDWPKALRMLERVERIARDRGLEPIVEQTRPVAVVTFEGYQGALKIVGMM